jgi:hypothetical protein
MAGDSRGALLSCSAKGQQPVKKTAIYTALVALAVWPVFLAGCHCDHRPEPRPREVIRVEVPELPRVIVVPEPIRLPERPRR